MTTLHQRLAAHRAAADAAARLDSFLAKLLKVNGLGCDCAAGAMAAAKAPRELGGAAPHASCADLTAALGIMADLDSPE